MMIKLKIGIILMLWGGSVYAQPLKPALKPLQFLLGKWEMTTAKGRIIETWTYDNHSTLKGKSFLISVKGDTSILETVQIRLENNHLFYIPSVTDQNERKPVRFKLIKSANATFIFENKTHDFPQRIIYQKKSKNDLLAWIEGNNNKGKYMKSEFPYRRVAE